MKRKSEPSTIPAVAVLAMADIAGLTLKAACATFAERATAGQRAFAEMGKLHHAISGNLKKGQTIYGELRKVGVKDSTTSNASYASRVWAEVIAPGHLAEADYDGFSFADCLAICKASGAKSVRRLAGEEIALIVRAQPATFDLELTSIYETGQTVAEAAAQKAAEAKRTEEELAAADRLAAERAEATRQAQAAAELESARLAAQTPSAPPASTGPSIANADFTPPSPANIHPMPGASAATGDTLAECLAAIDQITLAAVDLTPEGKLAVMAKLEEAIAFLGEHFAPAAVAA